jgi:hypothetical protein
VQARKTTFVAHVLEAAEAEFKIAVVDDHGPVEGARVWLDDERAKAAASAKNGTVTLKVPKGYHVIHVSARGMEVERPYHVVKAKIHDMTINLVWEKRQEFVSRALERQVDDAAPYMTKVAEKKSPPTSIPLAPSTSIAPEPVAGPGPAGRPASTGPIEIRLEDTPVVVATAAFPGAHPAPPSPTRPAQPSATQRPTQPKTAIGKATLTLKPLVPSASSPDGQENVASSDAPMVGEAIDPKHRAAAEAPVAQPSIDLAATMAPSTLPPAPPGSRRR